ncbi:hypothetical protein GCM10017691_18770 [Pseudonocardia petroleophila]
MSENRSGQEVGSPADGPTSAETQANGQGPASVDPHELEVITSGDGHRPDVCSAAQAARQKSGGSA